MNLAGKSEALLANDGARSGAVFANEISFSAGTFGDDEGDAVASDDEVATSFANTNVANLSHGFLHSHLDPRKESVTDHGKKQAVSPLETSPDASKQFSRLHQQNVAALRVRHGRQETCTVNASIMTQSWGRGPKRSNKAVVVDIDLPAWKEERIAVHS